MLGVPYQMTYLPFGWKLTPAMSVLLVAGFLVPDLFHPNHRMGTVLSVRGSSDPEADTWGSLAPSFQFGHL